MAAGQVLGPACPGYIEWDFLSGVLVPKVSKGASSSILSLTLARAGNDKPWEFGL